ncbi:MAG: hypothetical protein KDD55_05275 [Bdellovibrionales bacterium]|nr:hypothetical protein [Bdellovibrionales bacterium]
MNESQERRDFITAMERAKAEALQAEIRRKLTMLLNDPFTPESFKEAFVGIDLGASIIR